MSRRRRWMLTAAAATVVAVFAPATAHAHPLGNFSVNHLNALSFEPGQIINDAVVDVAEIPTAQALPAVDLDGDGQTSTEEMDGYGTRRCAELAAAQTLTVDGTPVPFEVTSASFVHLTGQAGLSTGRLECRLIAAVDLSSPRTVDFSDKFEPGRVGWREITAVGAGTRLVDPPVGTTSATDGLRSYPVDLLSSPMAVQQASFAVAPDGTAAPAAGAAAPAPDVGPDTVTPGAHLGGLGPLSGARDHLTDTFDDLIARRDLTIGVGLLAVTLAAILGASHALLPGHGKTVMAAYIAGRQGSIKDAALVGASVTGTHTGGVLALGLALTLSTSLAGETVIGWLGVASGLLIAGLGAALLVGIIRRRGQPTGTPARHHHGPLGHRHGHDHHHDPHNGHGHDALPIGGGRHDTTTGHVDAGHAGHHHAHSGHGHDHADAHADAHAGHDHGHTGHDHGPADRPDHADHHQDAGGRHEHDHDTITAIATSTATSTTEHAHEPESSPPAYSRRGLVGMGIAGGLVPSPSTLIILLSAIALGRTAFGILLVVSYGLGMALTLTVAGITLVVIRNRYNDRIATSSVRTRAMARRWTTIAPYGTALLVVVVGAGLTIRSLSIV